MSNLHEKLQIWGFENNFMIFRDSSLGACLRIEPIDVSCFSNESLNGLNQRLADFLNGLPQGMSLQFLQEITQGNESLLNAHAKTEKPDALALTKEITKKRLALLSKEDAQGNLPKQNLYLFLRAPMQSSLIEKKSLFSTKKKATVVSDKKLTLEIEVFKRRLDEVTKNLSAFGVKSTQLEQREIFDLMYRQWNPGSTDKPTSINSEDVRDQAIKTDGVPSLDGFSLGQFYHKVLTLKLLPDTTFAGMAEVLKDMPFDSKLFMTIEVLDQAKEVQTLQLQRKLSYAMVAGKKGVADLDSEAKLRDLETLLAETITGQEKIFKLALNILLKSKSENDLENQVSDVLMKIRELSGAEGMCETVAAFDIFCDFSIPNARAKERSIKINTSVLADFLPVYGFWKGHSSPRVLLRNRFLSLVAFDPFSGDMTNANQIVSGGSGSGKSFLTNLLLSQMLKETPRIFILDIGGSYKKLCDNLGGQYIPLGANDNLSINPFEFDGSDKATKDQKVKFLVGLVELMTKEHDSKGIGRLEVAEIENAILGLYESNKKPLMSDLCKILSAHTDVAVKRIGRILSTWCGNTPYGAFVDRATNIKLQSNIVCFDLKGLESQEELQSACLFLITDLVWREIQKDRTNIKFVVFDECWKLLENESGAQFIGEVFRTFRKYHASAIAISQTMDDFYKSKISSAIMPNSSIKWILKQKGANLQSLREALSLNDRELALITDLRSEKGLYSEAFLMCEDKRQLVRIEALPLEYWLATTDPKDIILLNQLKSENPTLSDFELLKMAADVHPYGASQPLRNVA